MTADIPVVFVYFPHFIAYNTDDGKVIDEYLQHSF